LTGSLACCIFVATMCQLAWEVQTMIKTLTKHGNSLALVIEKPILELIGAER